MGDPFTTMGIEPAFDLELEAIEKRYRELSRVLHPDRHVGASPGERRIALGKAVEVGEAYRILRDPIRRAEALLRLRGHALGEGQEPKPAPAFLMEMMEQREALAESRGDPARVDQLAAGIRAREKAVLDRLGKAFAEGQAESIRDASSLLGELRYYRRFLDEVGAIQETS